MRLGFIASLTATLVFAAAPALARGNAMIELMGHKWGKGRPTQALRARFPVGSPEGALADALHGSDFHFDRPRGDERMARNYWGGGMACTDIYTVRWRVDAQGRIADVTGDVEGSC
ncbi:MAG TPA: hypothetical protein VG407_05370 [Caulobacteraceae bacterium]|jgi:hypothetical protein|nr:hypothetical protein [Caulobacteraceae bacterium]